MATIQDARVVVPSRSQRVFGRHEAIRSCGEVNGLIDRLFG